MTLALSTFVVAAWWATLAVGLVVALVVWALLERLRREVSAVEDGVGDVWEMGQHVAQNTQAAHVLTTTKARAAELLDVVERRPAAERSEG